MQPFASHEITCRQSRNREIYTSSNKINRRRFYLCSNGTMFARLILLSKVICLYHSSRNADANRDHLSGTFIFRFQQSDVTFEQIEVSGICCTCQRKKKRTAMQFSFFFLSCTSSRYSVQKRSVLDRFRGVSSRDFF